MLIVEESVPAVTRTETPLAVAPAMWATRQATDARVVQARSGIAASIGTLKRIYPMKIKKLLVAALLATAIAALMGGLVGETKGQSMSPHDLFFHGLPTGRVASQSELGSLERANEWLNSPPCRRRLDWLTSAELLDW